MLFPDLKRIERDFHYLTAVLRHRCGYLPGIAAPPFGPL